MRTKAEISYALARAERQVTDLVATLEAIANAKPSTWEPDVKDQYLPWSQSLARAALAKVKP